MPVSFKITQEKLCCFIKGDVDHHTAPDIRDSIDDAIIINENVKTVELDFSEVSFMDSSGIGLVMGRYRLIVSKGKKLVVSNLAERDFKIMKMSGIEKLATITQKDKKGRLGNNL